MNLKSFRPASLDVWASSNSNPLALAWRLARTSLLDRAVIWGVAITLVLPAVFALFGGGFAFTGGVLHGVLLAGAFWLYEVVASIVLGIVTLGVFGRGNKLTTRVQQALFVVTAGAFLLCGGFVFSTLAVSWFGAAVGALVIALLAEWSLPEGGCSGGSCELPKK